MYGRWDLERIATEVEGKSLDDVRRYAAVFWSRLEELSDWRKLLKKIQDGEAVIQRRRELEQVTAVKLSSLYTFIYIYIYLFICLFIYLLAVYSLVKCKTERQSLKDVS